MVVLGRLLQFSSLILLPVIMLAQLNGNIEVRDMLIFVVIGFSGFYLGRMLEGYGRR